MPRLQLNQAMQYASEATSEAMQVVFMASFADNIFLSTGLNQLLAVIKHL